ncbi:MAG: hypothetical protein K6A05_08185 [Lachnospiraceae bacterium]|nr:hypothetical protein [Lachnospiraceae bacterium]
MNTNTKMIIHLLVTTIGPLVVWGLLHLAVVRAEGQNLELAPALRSAFWQIAAAYITGIVYLTLLVIWFYKYRNVSWGVRLLPLLPLLIFIGSRAYSKLSFEYQKRTYSAETFVTEASLESHDGYYETCEDGQKAVRVDDYISWVCIQYFLDKQNYDFTPKQMDEVVADSLPVLMEQLSEEPLCEGHYDAKTKATTYTPITMESWSYDNFTRTLTVQYSSQREPKVYDIDIN